MSDDFAICNRCKEMNTLADINLTYPEIFSEKEIDKIKNSFICVECMNIQSKDKTQWKHVEYGDKNEG